MSSAREYFADVLTEAAAEDKSKWRLNAEGEKTLRMLRNVTKRISTSRGMDLAVGLVQLQDLIRDKFLRTNGTVDVALAPIWTGSQSYMAWRHVE